jgi:hypothetical protein
MSAAESVIVDFERVGAGGIGRVRRRIQSIGTSLVSDYALNLGAAEVGEFAGLGTSAEPKPRAVGAGGKHGHPAENQEAEQGASRQIFMGNPRMLNYHSAGVV